MIPIRKANGIRPSNADTAPSDILDAITKPGRKENRTIAPIITSNITTGNLEIIRIIPPT